jgi:hypothetical protein
LAGATARANGADSYEIGFFTRAAGAAPAPFITVYFEGSAGLVLDKTVGITDSAGRVTVNVSAGQPGIYKLTARCDHTTGPKLASAEMEFVSRDVALPTPEREQLTNGEPWSWDDSAADPKSPQTVRSAEPIPGQIHRSYSVFDIDVASASVNGANNTSLRFYARDNKHNAVISTAYVATSLGADFWQSGDAWILADGVRLTDLVGTGAGAAFAFPVSGSAVLQFVSTVPIAFSVGIGVNEPLSADGTLYQYVCGSASAEEAQAVSIRSGEAVQMGPAVMEFRASVQDEPAALPLPEVVQVKIPDGSGLNFDLSIYG